MISVPIVRTAKLTDVIKNDVSRKPTSTSAVADRLEQNQWNEQIEPGARAQLDELDPGDVPGAGEQTRARRVIPSDASGVGRPGSDRRQIALLHGSALPPGPS